MASMRSALIGRLKRNLIDFWTLWLGETSITRLFSVSAISTLPLLVRLTPWGLPRLPKSSGR
ncbi:hypothetical protein D3C78_1986110 [compost metagenome]